MLKIWARRKGATEFLASIGTKPYVWLKKREGIFFLKRALEKNATRIREVLGNVITEIVKK